MPDPSMGTDKRLYILEGLKSIEFSSPSSTACLDGIPPDRSAGAVLSGTPGTLTTEYRSLPK